MKLSTIIIASFLSGSAAFQPAAKKTLQKSGGSVQPVGPITRNDMVAIRSPFWHDIVGTSAKGVTSGEYVVDRDYTVALTLIVVGLWLSLFGPSDTPVDMLGGIFHLWFGSFIGMQTMKTRAVFTKDSFELKSTANKYLGVYPDKGLIPKQRKNYVLGTNNKWRYDSFVNWDFFPSIHLPILVYFKETQTPLEMQKKGSLGLKQMDRRENGQMHWFPAYANVRQLREQFEARGCKKIGPVHGEEFMKSD
ncbi:hypothetical protein ACHAXN_012699 [Cyclotella atomus]|jgi:NIMA (never in mitosis gene a)-related kinase